MGNGFCNPTNSAYCYIYRLTSPDNAIVSVLNFAYQCSFTIGKTSVMKILLLQLLFVALYKYG